MSDAELQELVQLLKQLLSYQLLGQLRLSALPLIAEEVLARLAPPGPQGTAQPQPAILVTLDQIAAAVGRSKRTLEKYRARMPAPVFKGGRGRAALWDWSAIRPWLEAQFGIPLDEKMPWARRT